MKLLAVLILLLSFAVLYSQNRPCYTDEANVKFAAKDAFYGAYREKLEGLIQQRIQKSVSYGESVITIPVVVHVVYNTPAQNISDQQILSQIDVLNADYRLQNSDLNKIRPVFQGFESDVRVEFCLAQRDPQGNATTGIIRTSSSVTSWGCDDSVKFSANGGSDAWPCSQYLNIWVCNLNCANGYAYYPGIPAPYDGVVVHYYVFGSTGNVWPGARGRTATHEIGHWLNLYHPFYDECLGADAQTCETLGDRVCDTPSDTITWDCTATNACVDSPIDYPDMWENYMNYTTDSCRVMFTNGQVERMRAALYLARTTLITSPGCIPPGTDYYDAAIAGLIAPLAPQCHQYIAPEIRIGSGCTMPMTSAVFRYRVDNGSWQQYTWNGTLNNSQFANVVLPQIAAAPGSHVMTVVASLPNGQSDMNANNDTLIFLFNVLQNGDGAFPPYSETFESSAFPPAGWTIEHPAESVRWQRVTSASAFGNGAASAMYGNFYLNDQGRRSGMITCAIDLSTWPLCCPPHLTFSYAYPLPSPPGTYFADTLNIYFSVDCGDTWTKIWGKGGNDLATAPFYPYTAPFVPLASEWTAEAIALFPYTGLEPLVYFKFENVNDWGNCLYVDNINFDFISFSPDENKTSYQISAFPSPVKQGETLNITVVPETRVVISLCDLYGRTLITEDAGRSINTGSISPGIYLVNVSVDGKIIFRNKIAVE